MAVSIGTIVINGTFQLGFLKKELLRYVIIPFFAAFFVALMGRNRMTTMQDLLKYVLIVSVIQSIITLLGFFIPPIGTILRSVQTLDLRLTDTLSTGRRAFGLGSGFDIGSFVMSVSLLITSYFYLLCEKNKRWAYVGLFLLQGFAGLLMARSIIIGFFFSFLFIFLVSKEKKKKLYLLARVLLVISIVVILVVVVFPSLLQKYSKAIQFIFEFFMQDKLAKGGKTNNSLDILFGRMYFLPEEPKTWLLGEGLFLSPNGYAYRNIDPLYMRYLLYFGLPGILASIGFLASLLYRVKAPKVNLTFGVFPRERKLYNLFLVMVFFQSLVIYVKLNSHCYPLLFFMIWFLHMHRSQNTNSIASATIKHILGTRSQYLFHTHIHKETSKELKDKTTSIKNYDIM